MPSRDNPYSHLTAKDRDRASFPTRKLLGLGHIRGRVLDYGCGYGADVDFLREKGFDVEGYDPHHAPERPEGTFDTVLCHYVLNVLMQREQTDVLMEVSEYLRPSGTAFYSVRRDLRRTGFRQHYKHGVPTYQTNVRLPFDTVVRTEFCEIYRYRHYTQTTSEGNCSLCTPSADTTLVSESARSYAIVDERSRDEDYRLVIPKRHVTDYFDLTEGEQRACWLMVNRVHSRIQERASPTDITVGVNIEGKEQAPDHAHIRLILQ